MKESARSIGDIGEAVAAKFLQDKGFEVCDTNFQRRAGEIDLVVKKGRLIFIEVKSVRCRIPEEIPKDGANAYRPEEQVSAQKRERLRRIIDIYLHTHDVSADWRVDLLCVFLDFQREESRVKWLKNIII